MFGLGAVGIVLAVCAPIFLFIVIHAFIIDEIQKKAYLSKTAGVA